MKIPSELLQKNIVRFAKIGPAIYHSHHDMIRFWERAVKRADIPMRLTQGFNPHPRLVFPHALGLGIQSRHEAIVLELSDHMDTTTMLNRLRQACGDTLEILAVESLPPVKKSLQIVRSSYAITGWPEIAFPRLADAASALLAQESIVVERGAPGDKRKADIRPYLEKVQPDGHTLLVELRHTPTGSARPDEVAKLVAETMGVYAADLFIEKTGMELE